MGFAIAPDHVSGDTTLEKLKKRSFIGPGTLVALDPLGPDCYASGVVPAAVANGDLILSLLDSGDPATVVTAPGSAPGTIGTAGIVWDNNTGEITLPDAAKLAGDATHFGFGLWIKPRAAPASNTICPIVSWQLSSSAAATQWVMYRYNDTILAQIAGQPSVAVPVTVGTPCFVFFEVIVTGGSLVIKAYKNKALVATSAVYALGSTLTISTTNGSDQVSITAATGRPNLGSVIAASPIPVGATVTELISGSGGAGSVIRISAPATATDTVAATTSAVLPRPTPVTPRFKASPYSNFGQGDIGAFMMQDFSVEGARSVGDFLTRAYDDNLGVYS